MKNAAELFISVVMASVAIGVLSACATTTESKPGDGVFAAPKSVVYAATIAAASSLSWEIIHSESSVGLVQARTPPSISTEGDQVTIMVQSGGDEQATVSVRSTAKQAYDWGKGGRNIERLFDEIRRQLLEISP